MNNERGTPETIIHNRNKQLIKELKEGDIIEFLEIGNKQSSLLAIVLEDSRYSIISVSAEAPSVVGYESRLNTVEGWEIIKRS